MSHPILFHIGYHKTGTTWLQNFVFDSHECGFASPWGRQAGLAVDTMVCGSPFRFDTERVRAAFQMGILEARKANLIPVISNEALCGLEFARTRYERTAADRIKLTFPEAKILIFIREQQSAILSHYKEYIARGQSGSLDEYVGGRKLPAGFHPVCSLDRFEYDLLIGYYITLFGK